VSSQIKKYRFTRKGHHPCGYEEGEVVELPERCAVGYEHWICVEGDAKKAVAPNKSARQSAPTPEPDNPNVKALELVMPPRAKERQHE